MVSEKQSFDSGTFAASLPPSALKGELFILLEVSYSVHWDV